MAVLLTLNLLLLAFDLLTANPGPLLEMWQDEKILMEPLPDPYMQEWEINGDCVIGGPWDRWHDACNARLVKII